VGGQPHGPDRATAWRRDDDAMLAGGTEELATRQARGAFHVLTAVNAVEFQVTVRWIQSIHRFCALLFSTSIG
jgi:hypothetical protein